MSNLTSSIRLLVGWNGQRAGTILPIVPAGQARLMIQNRIAELVKPSRKKAKKRAGTSKKRNRSATGQ